MVDTLSPLQAINQKESEVRHQVEEARRRVEDQIQFARQEAEQTIARARQQGQAEAKTLYEQGIEEAQAEAKAIVAAAHQEATVLRSQAAVRLDNAVRQIVELVLPVGVPLSKDAGRSDMDSTLE